jgi:hypothetical protein
MLETIAEHRCFGGTQAYYRHDSKAVGLPMRFSVYVPPQAEHGKVPALFYLPGLTCTEETFMIKAGAQRVAAQLGMLLVSPDTSPRDAKVAGEADDWDFGLGAGANRHRPHRHLRPFDGWPWGADASAQASGSFQFRLGLCPHLRAQPVPVGTQGLYRLPRQR